MTEEERKLLQLAAKAAGIELLGQCDERSYIREITDGMMIGWNPIINDGDALRLAVKLELCIDQLGANVNVFSDGPCGSATVPIFNGVSLDPCAATRRAIVMVAAEIGKEMP